MTIGLKFCAQCDSQFQPARAMQAVCSPICASRKVRKDKAQAKERQKLDRMLDKQRAKALETIPELIKAAQREFNAYIRARDAGMPCICCGKPLGDGEVGGAYDCGHYRSTGAASHLRFDERNAHAQRKYCNNHRAGNVVEYRIGLVNRIGLDAVEALEADNTPQKWDRDALRQIKTIYRAKLRDLKKGQS